MSVLCPYLNNTSILCPCCPYSMRTLSTTSVLSAYSLCSLYAVSVLPPRLDVCTRRTLSTTSVLSPYCIRRYPLLSAGNFGQFVHPLQHPYWLRTLYAKFRPYSIRSDPQHPCVGVKWALHFNHCPRLWNSLPADVRFASSLTTFRRKLKTHLFRQSYPDTVL